MNHKDLIEKVLPYLKAYKGDLEYQSRVDVDYLNSCTNGTPMFGQDNEGEAEKEAEQYVSELKALIEELNKVLIKTYEVSLSLNASITVEVTAENELEAEEKAIAKFYNKDLDHVDADHYHYYEMHLLNDHYVTEVEA
jgi:hypothetical protein